MDQEKLKKILEELNAIEDTIKTITGEYETKLSELGGQYDKQLDEAKKNYDDKFEVLKSEISVETPL